MFIGYIIVLCFSKCQCSSQFQQTKSGIALLYNEETSNTYDVCLKLTKEVLTIQKLDVVCIGGSEFQVNVSAPEVCIFIHAQNTVSMFTISFCQ